MFSWNVQGVDKSLQPRHRLHSYLITPLLDTLLFFSTQSFPRFLVPFLCTIFVLALLLLLAAAPRGVACNRSIRWDSSASRSRDNFQCLSCPTTMTSFRDEESRGDLQSRVNVVLDSAEGCRVDLSILMCQLLEAQETAAFVWIWDLAKARGVVISASVRVAMERLHQLGKGNVPDGTLILPKNSGARIKAARRLHKIVMGPVRGSKLAARSAAVTPDAELRAAAWLQTTEVFPISPFHSFPPLSPHCPISISGSPHPLSFAVCPVCTHIFTCDPT